MLPYDCYNFVIANKCTMNDDCKSRYQPKNPYTSSSIIHSANECDERKLEYMYTCSACGLKFKHLLLLPFFLQVAERVGGKRIC